jgi:DNA-3-methyladenine glycosylase
LTTARGRGRGRQDPALARGPACLTQVLAVDGGLDGADLTAWPGGIAVLGGEPVPDAAVASGPRVGIRAATGRPWRYWIAGAPSVSRIRRAQRA